MYDLIIRDATIVHSSGRQVADIAVEGSRIAYVGGRAAGAARKEIPAIGKFVMPGVIDSHVHFRDPGFSRKEDWRTGSSAAIASGVTTVLEMPNTNPATVDHKTVKDKLARAAKLSVANYGVWVGATPKNLAEAGDLFDEGQVCGIKVFMGDTTGALAVDDATLERIFHETRGLIGVHAEDQGVLGQAAKKWQRATSPVHNDVRPPEAAVAAVGRLIDLVKRTGRSVHICHLSTSGELNALDPHRGDLPISCEVTPHHLFLSVETAGDKFGNFIKCNPPIRSELDRRALWTAVKRGRIDTFASDHAPHTIEEKRRPYWQAPSGIPGVETLYPLLMSAVSHGRFSLERLIEMCCEAPARIFGLQGKGVIAEGADADLVLFSEGATEKLTREMLHSRVRWSPFVGREVGAMPELVMVQGRIVARRGKLVDSLKPGHAVTYARG